MSSHASTTQGSGKGDTAVPTPSPQLLDRTPAGPPPTWAQLRTPPQGAAFARPTSPATPPELDDNPPPLFGGALGAKESPLRMRHLMALCAWALALTLLGLGVGLWAMLLLMSPDVPGWYEPVIVVTGLVGIGLAIASFVTADKGNMPWILMGASTAVLFVAIGITSVAA